MIRIQCYYHGQKSIYLGTAGKKDGYLLLVEGCLQTVPNLQEIDFKNHYKQEKLKL